MIEVNTKTGCWIWQKSKTAAGYGQIHKKRKNYYVHRFVYECLIGPIKTGNDLHHLCGNRACCNPSHLEELTRHQHNLKSAAATKNHCVNGHEFSEENTQWYKGRGGYLRRTCRECHNNSARRTYRSRKDRPMTKWKKCAVPSCLRIAQVKGWCTAHYKRTIKGKRKLQPEVPVRTCMRKQG